MASTPLSIPSLLDQHYMVVPRNADPMATALAATQPASTASSSAASASLLNSLTHVPLGMHLANQRPRPKQKNTGRIAGVKDGKTISKMFNPVASRPYPALTPLERQIQVTMANSALLFTTSVTVPTYGNQAFQLNFFPDYAQYASTFDQYKFDQIEVWLEPLSNNAAVNTTSLATCVDLDDANAPTAFTDVSERQGALLGTSLSGHYHRWKPHVAVAEYSGAFTSFGNAPAGWIDVASPGVQHYGFKAATVGADGVARGMQISYRALISFRGSAI